MAFSIGMLTIPFARFDPAVAVQLGRLRRKQFMQIGRRRCLNARLRRNKRFSLGARGSGWPRSLAVVNQILEKVIEQPYAQPRGDQGTSAEHDDVAAVDIAVFVANVGMNRKSICCRISLGHGVN